MGENQGTHVVVPIVVAPPAPAPAPKLVATGLGLAALLGFLGICFGFVGEPKFEVPQKIHTLFMQITIQLQF